ncbi:hypothetical protein BJ742DRAFT_687239 [Cladochytrium replicatum]|nr:hypothetical protein BJ742DRAFT_687239 [Cladochytrium replicatum]
MPTVDGTQQSTAVTTVPSVLTAAVANAKLVVTFSRPVTGSGGNKNFTPGTAQSFIWAYGSTNPGTSASGAVAIHDEKGTFSQDFFTTSNAASGIVQWCNSGNIMCVAGIPDKATSPSSITMVMWSTSTAVQWMGVGIGAGMSDADVVIGWKSTAGATLISDRTAKGQSMPTVDASQQATAVAAVPAAAASLVAGAKLVVVYSRAITPTGSNKAFTPGTSQSFIWAYGSVNPGASASGTVQLHDQRGTFSRDFFTAPTSNNNGGSADSSGAIINLDTKTAWYIHGALLTAAWTLFPFAGIFIARYLKDALGVWWYRLHLGFMLIGTTVLSVAGILLIVLTTPPPHFDLSGWNPHRPLGLALGIDAILQSVLGFVCNAMWSPERKSIPWWDRLHWWNGRILWLAAMANVYFGLALAGASMPLIIAFFVFVGVSFAALIAGQFIFGQVHHMKKDDDYGNPGAYSMNTKMDIGQPMGSNTYNRRYDDEPSYGGGNGGYGNSNVGYTTPNSGKMYYNDNGGGGGYQNGGYSNGGGGGYGQYNSQSRY